MPLSLPTNNWVKAGMIWFSKFIIVALILESMMACQECYGYRWAVGYVSNHWGVYPLLPIEFSCTRFDERLPDVKSNHSCLTAGSQFLDPCVNWYRFETWGHLVLAKPNLDTASMLLVTRCHLVVLLMAAPITLLVSESGQWLLRLDVSCFLWKGQFSYLIG